MENEMTELDRHIMDLKERLRETQLQVIEAQRRLNAALVAVAIDNIANHARKITEQEIAMLLVGIDSEVGGMLVIGGLDGQRD